MWKHQVLLMIDMACMNIEHCMSAVEVARVTSVKSMSVSVSTTTNDISSVYAMSRGNPPLQTTIIVRRACIILLLQLTKTVLLVVVIILSHIVYLGVRFCYHSH